MNYLPYTGWWFYGATDTIQRASFFCSWGLRASATATVVSKAVFAVYYRFRRIT